MCGIAGRVNAFSEAPVEASLVRRMCDLLAHRGPDGEGQHVDGIAGLGHRRLAIIDLSPGGHQPMATEDGRLWITYNGEVYNFLELRPELEARKHRFRSRSDTEVILAAYREWGVGCLDRLAGMFAFAIWDAPARTLFLARDRLGKKPLYYLVDGDGIAFASEPKAFLADPAFKPDVDTDAVWDYLTYQYVPSPRTAFRGVQKLPPAHYLLLRGRELRVSRYWALRYADKRHLTEGEAAEELEVRLRRAVERRLISDVPLGAFLSGGIDSGTVVALMAQSGVGRVKTYSIGFEEREYDEVAYARLVAERYGTEHHELVVRPDALGILPKLVWHYNEPYADSSAIPTYYLAEFTRRHVTVALNGDAGDENFAGYRRYLDWTLWGGVERIPAWVRRRLGRLSGAPVPDGPMPVAARARRAVQRLTPPREGRYANLMSVFGGALKAELCTEEFRASVRDRDSAERLLAVYRASDALDFVDAMLDVDVNTYLPDDLLVKVDIATMAHGLEGRSPFLDHELMEFCASLPSTLKLNGRTTKHLLRRVASGLLPAAVVQRPKMGFGVPIRAWFRNGLREMAYDVLLSPRALARGYFRPETVRRLLDEHARGVHAWHVQLWTLLMLEQWHRTFIDSGTLPQSPARDLILA